MKRAQEGTLLIPRHTPQSCEYARAILDRVGDKWTVLVVSMLSERRMRFTEIKRATTGISQRMLTMTLRALERDGLVTRTVHPTIPPRVDYELTDLGRTLIEPVNALLTWAVSHGEAIKSARRRYDAAEERAEQVTDSRRSSAAE